VRNLRVADVVFARERKDHNIAGDELDLAAVVDPHSAFSLGEDVEKDDAAAAGPEHRLERLVLG
jgi:hypothetical protein